MWVKSPAYIKDWSWQFFLSILWRTSIHTSCKFPSDNAHEILKTVGFSILFSFLPWRLIRKKFNLWICVIGKMAEVRWCTILTHWDQSVSASVAILYLEQLWRLAVDLLSTGSWFYLPIILHLFVPIMRWTSWRS